MLCSFAKGHHDRDVVVVENDLQGRLVACLSGDFRVNTQKGQILGKKPKSAQDLNYNPKSAHYFPKILKNAQNFLKLLKNAQTI